ncbi:pentapeptide repeat-containing protein [Streptomyces venezuelae]|nr:pentapeptide repeat-containing protein [Streptomyces venezuelae]CUM44161.1 hypothetical protein BN2537_17287 [Streptomyces venezuelae]
MDRSVQEPSVDQERRTKPRPVLFPVPADLWRALLDLRTSGAGDQSAARAPPLILSCHRRVRRRPVRHGHRSGLRRVAVRRHRTPPGRGNDGKQWPVVVAAALPGLAALVALVFTWISVGQTNKELRIAEGGQITTRFNAAVSHLGSTSQDVRFGGIYALERLMQDSTRDQPRVISVLSAFVRTRAQVPAGGFVKQAPGATPRTAPDVTAAISVLGDRPVGHDGTAQLDFSGADLRGLTLSRQVSATQQSSGKTYQPSRMDLSHANLDGADLRGAELSYVALGGAWLRGANLADARLHVVELQGAVLDEADLSNAEIARSGMYNASLKKADLSGSLLMSIALGAADLDSADLSGTRLSGTDLHDSNLAGVNLEGSDITADQVVSALPHPSTRLPEHLARDPRVRERIAEVEEHQLMPTPTTA